MTFHLDRCSSLPRWVFSFVFSLNLGLSGCRPAQTASVENTRVGRGELFQTGQVSYDQYFSNLYGISTEVTRAATEQQTACGDLLYALGLSPAAPASKLAETLHEKAQEVEKSGHRYRVEGYSAVTEGPKPDDAARSLGRSLDACLRAHGALIERLRKIPERTSALGTTLTPLETSIDEDFFGFKRQEVHSETAASRRVLSILDAKATALANEGEKTVLDVTAAVASMHPVPETKAESPPEKEKKKPAGGKRNSGTPSTSGSRGSSTAPPAPPAPPSEEKKAPKPKSKPKTDDFNP